jgi:hypothetical protein
MSVDVGQKLANTYSPVGALSSWQLRNARQIPEKEELLRMISTCERFLYGLRAMEKYLAGSEKLHFLNGFL